MAIVRHLFWRAAGVAAAVIAYSLDPAVAQDQPRPFGLRGLTLSAGLGGGFADRGDLGFLITFGTTDAGPRLELSGDFQSGQTDTVQIDAQSGPSFSFGGLGPDSTATIGLTANVDEGGALAHGSVALGVVGAGGLFIESLGLTPAGDGGAVSQYASSKSTDGAAVVALATRWNGETSTGTAAVYAVVMDGVETLFLGLGDLDATQRHEVHDDVQQRRQTAAWIWPLGQSNGWAISGRVSPWLAHMTQQLDQTTTLDINPTIAAAPMPSVAIMRADQSRTRTAGLSLGLEVARPINETWALSAYVDLGLGSYHNRHSQTGYTAVDDILIDQSAPDEVSRGTTHLGDISLQLIRKLDAKSSISFGVKGDYRAAQPWLRPTADGNAVLGQTSRFGWLGSVQYRFSF